MKVLITYDLSENHSYVKDELIKKGWKESITGNNGVVCSMPNTCFWKEIRNSSDARDEVKSIVSEPVLQKLICVEFDGWAAIKGQ
jgi:hypothetical protein